MLGWSCSAACADFFERDRVAIEEAPQRPDAEGKTLRGDPCLNFRERDVGGFLHDREDQGGMGFDPLRTPITALPLGKDIADVTLQSTPSDRARRADPKPLRRLATR
jgi:hypothetical protein